MRTITYREALREALREELLRDDSVFLIGEDIADPFGGTYKVTAGLTDVFGTERVRNTPISELGVLGAAVGAAITGARPVAEIMYVDFMTCGLDSLVNQAAKIRFMSAGQIKVPLVVRTQGGAGRSSAAQHAQSLEAWFVHTPGLKVVMPATPYDAKGLLKAAIRDEDPVVFIEHKLLYNTEGLVPEEEYLIPLGKADVKRHGDDVTVVATSRMVLKVITAAELLAKRGVSVEVVDPMTLVPLDEETILSSVRKTRRLVIVHEAVERNGFGAEIAAMVAKKAFFDLDGPINRVAGMNVPIAFAPKLENYVIPDVPQIVAGINEIL
jgi:pyruvate dehydrogenase E1 component beta subunit